MRKPFSLNALKTWGGGWGTIPLRITRPVFVQIWQDACPHLWFSYRQGYPAWICVFKEEKKQQLEDPGATGISMFLYTWYDLYMPSGIHFSPGVKYTSSAKDGKVGSSFLTWFPVLLSKSVGLTEKASAENQLVPPFFPSQFWLSTSLIVQHVKEASVRTASPTIHACTDADLYSTQKFKTCPLFLWLPYLKVKKNTYFSVLHQVLNRNVTIFVFHLSKGTAGSHQVYMKTNLRHQMWKHLTIKTRIPVPVQGKREVGVPRQSFLLPMGNIFIFAHSFLKFYEDTLKVCYLNSTSKKKPHSSAIKLRDCAMKLPEHQFRIF